jgi:hypothetical protein
MKIGQKDGLRDAMKVARTIAAKIGATGTRAALNKASSNTLNQSCCPVSRFQNISRTAHSLPRQQRRLR